jgi:hypothetical protein
MLDNCQDFHMVMVKDLSASLESIVNDFQLNVFTLYETHSSEYELTIQCQA